MLKQYILPFCFILSAQLAQAQVQISTSVAPERCTLIEENEQELTAKFNCRGFSGFKVYYKTSDLRGWIVLEKNKKVYDTWEMITENAIGLSPYVANELIWQQDKAGDLEFLIFEVSSIDPEDVNAEITLFFVTKMEKDRLVFVSQEVSLQAAQQKTMTMGLK